MVAAVGREARWRACNARKGHGAPIGIRRPVIRGGAEEFKYGEASHITMGLLYRKGGSPKTTKSRGASGGLQTRNPGVLMNWYKDVAFFLWGAVAG